MATNNPPRFVPTLTETAPTVAPSTAVEDLDYFERKDPVDSMLDLDLSDLDAPVTRIEKVSPLGAYQGSHVVNPQAVSHVPVVPMAPSVHRHTAAAPVVPPRPIPAAQAQAAAPAQAAATAAPPKPVQPPPSPLPADWQNQLQVAVQQAVRQELQQQMPFLLLQWSKQIDDKLTPHLHQQLVKLVQAWQPPHA